MTAEQVGALYAAHAFDPAMAVQDMHAVHVPFDELAGADSADKCEAGIRDALLAGRRIAVVGTSGAGKSSVLSYALGPLVEGVLPVRVPVALGQGAAATDPVAFADRVIDCVLDQVAPNREHAARAAADKTDPRRSSWTRRVEVKPSAWGVSVQLAREVSQVAQTREVTPYRVMEIAREVVDLVASELVPVLVLDDTDKWINRDGGPSHATRTRFFGAVVRVIAEHLGCAAAIAVHEQYLADPAFKEAHGFLEELIAIPSIPGAPAGMRILARRAALALGIDEEVVLDGVVAPAAGTRLHDYYRHRGRRNLRGDFLQIVAMAVVKAREVGAEEVGERHVAAALTEFA